MFHQVVGYHDPRAFLSLSNSLKKIVILRTGYSVFLNGYEEIIVFTADDAYSVPAYVSATPQNQHDKDNTCEKQDECR